MGVDSHFHLIWAYDEREVTVNIDVDSTVLVCRADDHVLVV